MGNDQLDVAVRQAGDLDRLIEAFYEAASSMEWQRFRQNGLAELCGWTGASAAAWLLRADDGHAGEFVQWPEAAGLSAAALSGLPFAAGHREIEIPWPTGTAAVVRGLALEAVHRGTRMYSVLALREPPGRVEREALRRGIGHLVQASTIALRRVVQRDEWLVEMGRSSRGSAALVDRHGSVYIASQRFRQLVTEEGADPELPVLPFPLPTSGLVDGAGFQFGGLQFRVRQQGELFLVNARRPHPLDALSPREQEIARALALGKTFKSVAREFALAISTVANHASRIYRKLGIYRREELVELLRRAADSKLG